MGEKCDPAIYYQRVRLPMSGWRNNPDLPEGLVYEGQFGGQVRACCSQERHERLAASG